MAKYVGCVVCGARWVAADDDTSSGCSNCGSSVAALERDLSPEAEAVLREHGVRAGTPSREAHESSRAYYWM